MAPLLRRLRGHVHKLSVPGLLLAALVLLAGPEEGGGARVDAAVAATRSGDMIQLNFRDVELVSVIRLMSELTGKNFLLDGEVRGKVTLIAPEPVSIEEAYRVFVSILDVQGFTVVQQGAVVKIIPAADVRDQPLPTTQEGAGAPPAAAGDAFETRLIRLQHAQADAMRGLLSPLVSGEGGLLSYGPTNTLILTETAANIARLKTIIAALDVAAPDRLLRVVPLEHANAPELAASLQTALQRLAEPGTDGEAPAERGERRRRRREAPESAAAAPRVLADARTNSVILVATAAAMEAAGGIIAALDIPTPPGRGRAHVHYLSHADAEGLAEVLTAQSADIARLQAEPAAEPAAEPTEAPAGRTPTGITVTADKPTNSLVITADPRAYAMLRDTIRKLDIRTPQVLVQGLIAEVTLDTARELGVEWRLIGQPDGTQVFAGATGTAGAGGVLSNPTALLNTPGFLVGILRDTIRLDGDRQLLDIPLLLRALRSDTDVEVLATPNLLTTDNEEAEIIVGEQRPFLTSVNRIPDAGVVNVSNTFDFRDTGITLRVTPQIGQGSTVRAELFLEITRFVSEAEVGAVTTTKRSTRTTVIVDDGQTIVLGGLIQDTVNEGETRVPFLGSVALLGGLFRQSAVRRNKTNLLIFLTPHIISTPDDVERVTSHAQGQAQRPEAVARELRQGRPQPDLEWLLD